MNVRSHKLRLAIVAVVAATVGGIGSAVAYLNTDGTGFRAQRSFGATNDPNPLTNSDGAYPAGRLVLSGSALYGSGLYGGISDYGVVFSLSLRPDEGPQLAIRSSGTDMLLTWPASYAGFNYEGQNYPGFTLLSTNNLLSPARMRVSPGPVVVNGELVLTNAYSAAQWFYALSPPSCCRPPPPSCDFIWVSGVWAKNTTCRDEYDW